MLSLWQIMHYIPYTMKCITQRSRYWVLAVLRVEYSEFTSLRERHHSLQVVVAGALKPGDNGTWRLIDLLQAD